MATIQVRSDDGAIVLDVYQDFLSQLADPDAVPDQDWTVGVCRACGQVITDRGHTEDTLQVCEDHADSCSG